MPRRSLDTDKLVSLISKSGRKGAKSKQELADKLGFTYQTVHLAVNSLVEQGTIQRAGIRETGQRGRPEVLYRSA